MQQDRKDDISFENSLELAITKAGKTLAGEMDDVAGLLNVTYLQMCAILLIAHDASTTGQQIAGQLGVDAATVSRSLDGLEHQGLLVRSRSVDDRRLINLRLTRKGGEVADQARGILSRHSVERFKAFSKAEYFELQRLLRKCLVD